MPAGTVKRSVSASVRDHWERFPCFPLRPVVAQGFAITIRLRPLPTLAAGTLNNLAALYYLQGRYAQAEPLYKRSLAIMEKALGPDHPDVALSLENLAALYRATNRMKEAEVLEKRAAAIRAITR